MIEASVGMRSEPPRGVRILTRLAVLCMAIAVISGCQASETVSEEDREEIRATLAEYLPAMAEAYSSGNIEVLRGVAAEKEMAIVHKKVKDLMEQESRVVVPTLQGFEIEDITLWNYANAFVTTLETWDIKVLASGSDFVTSEVEGQRSRVKYQVKRREDGWIVLYRVIETTFEN